MANKKEKNVTEPEINETLENDVVHDVNQDQSEENTKDKDLAVLEKLMEENAKLKDDYLRAFADAENTKKRCQQEIEKNNKYAIANFAKNLLGVADNLQRAIDAASKDENNQSCEALLKGVELTQNELTKVFGKFNISKMDILGSVFDPNFHQVIQEVPDNTKPAIIDADILLILKLIFTSTTPNSDILYHKT